MTAQTIGHISSLRELDVTIRAPREVPRWEKIQATSDVKVGNAVRCTQPLKTIDKVPCLIPSGVEAIITRIDAEGDFQIRFLILQEQGVTPGKLDWWVNVEAIAISFSHGTSRT